MCPLIPPSLFPVKLPGQRHAYCGHASCHPSARAGRALVLLMRRCSPASPVLRTASVPKAILSPTVPLVLFPGPPLFFRTTVESSRTARSGFCALQMFEVGFLAHAHRRCHGRRTDVADIVAFFPLSCYVGNLRSLNELAKQARADHIIHTGDFGFYDDTSLERIADK